MLLSQQDYTQVILERASIDTCNPITTPLENLFKLSAESGSKVQDSTKYRSLADALQVLTFTRPDITYVVQQMCLFMHYPKEPHFDALKTLFAIY